MGYNTVAVLYNDFMGDLEKDGGRYAPKIAEAMRGVSYAGEHRARHVSFGAGMVISQAHADYSQVVIIGRNSGQRAWDAKDLDQYALAQMRDCLERHGYKVTKPRKAKRSALGTAAREGGDEGSAEGKGPTP